MEKINSVIVIFVVLLIAANGLFAQQEKLTSTGFQDDIEKLMLEKNIPALGIGIIKDGELRQIMVFGELKKDTPAPYNAIFNIASLTKPISALLTLTLVSNGDWNLDEPLYNYWVDPDIKDSPYLKILTTRHVLTHQTGFDNWRWMNKSKKLTFNFKPGTQCSYSGEGFEYLRLAIEQKFNKPFEELADSILFKPYGMNDTRFLWDEDFHKLRYAEEHSKEGEPYNYKKRTTNALASDRVLTTIEDYGLFAVNVMKKTGLTEEVYNDMIRPQAIVRENVSYGLCWYMKQNYYQGESALTHTGYDPGACTKVVLLPESKRGIIVFANGDNGHDIMKRVESEFFGDFDEHLTPVKTN